MDIPAYRGRGAWPNGARAREAILRMSGFKEAHMLEQLERNFYCLTGKTFDRQLSLHLLRQFRQLLSSTEEDEFGPLIDAFVEQNKQKLDEIFRDYANDERCNPLLFQPESLLFFERLEHDPFKLKELWAKVLPLKLLEDLAAIWGRPL